MALPLLLIQLTAGASSAGPVAYIRADETKRIFGYVRAVETIQ